MAIVVNERKRGRTFSVVIPTLNEEQFIGRCIQSIHEHCGRDTEIIVVDNGSIDNTIGIAAKLGTQVVQADGSSIAAQRNLGAQYSTGAILAFLDADCTVLTGWHAAALRNFEDQNVVAAGAIAELPKVNTTWVQRTWEFMNRRRSTEPTSTSWLPSANLWIRTSAFRQVDGFDESFESCEDADIGYRLSKTGKIIHDNAIRIEHHRDPRSVRQFFRKEVWHGKNSFDGFASGRITLNELPSLCSPVWLLASLIVACGGLVWFAFSRKTTMLAAGLIAASVPPLAYALRSLITKGNVSMFPQVLFLYTVYFSARMVAMAKWARSRVIG